MKKIYRLIAADLIKQKVLDAGSRAIQQIIFTRKTDNAIRVCYILEKSKETILEFSKKEQQNFVINIKMFEYNKVNVELSDTQLKKTKKCC